MTRNPVAPSTIDGIKRLAKSIKRERNIPHHEALDLAARQAGFQNIRHAQHELEHQPACTAIPPPGHALYLSAYWVGQGGRTHGRETLQVRLPKPLAEILEPRQVDRVRNLGGFHMEFADHLERRVDLDDQEDAQRTLLAAARALQFLAVTGLRPVTTRTFETQFRSFRQNLPGHDHPSEWVDPASKAWVYMDEPYHHVQRVDRQDWARAAGLSLVDTDWEGLYAPGMSAPYLFCQDAALAARLHEQLALLPARTSRPEPHAWEGESGAYFEPYVSPARAVSGKVRRPRAQPAPRGLARAGALPYGAPRGGMTSRWRPAERMPLAQHLVVGPLLHALYNSHLPAAAHRAIGEVRSTLDDWLQMEYPGEEMSADQFHEAYYGTHRAPIGAVAMQLTVILQARSLLEAGYRDSGPRHQLIKRLDAAAAALQKKTKGPTPATAASTREAMSDRELVRWALDHGWHYFHMNAQLRSPRGGLTTVENWDAIPAHIRTQIREQMAESPTRA